MRIIPDGELYLRDVFMDIKGNKYRSIVKELRTYLDDYTNSTFQWTVVAIDPVKDCFIIQGFAKDETPEDCDGVSEGGP